MKLKLQTLVFMRLVVKSGTLYGTQDDRIKTVLLSGGNDPVEG